MAEAVEKNNGAHFLSDPPEFFSIREIDGQTMIPRPDVSLVGFESFRP